MKEFPEVRLGAKLEQNSPATLRELYAAFLEGNFDGDDVLLQFFENTLRASGAEAQSVSHVRRQVIKKLLSQIETSSLSGNTAVKKRIIEWLESFGAAVDVHERHVHDLEALVESVISSERECVRQKIAMHTDGMERWQIEELLRANAFLQEGSFEERLPGNVVNKGVRTVLEAVRSALAQEKSSSKPKMSISEKWNVAVTFDQETIDLYNKVAVERIRRSRNAENLILLALAESRLKNPSAFLSMEELATRTSLSVYTVRGSSFGIKRSCTSSYCIDARHGKGWRLRER